MLLLWNENDRTLSQGAIRAIMLEGGQSDYAMSRPVCPLQSLNSWWSWRYLQTKKQRHMKIWWTCVWISSIGFSTEDKLLLHVFILYGGFLSVFASNIPSDRSLLLTWPLSTKWTWWMRRNSSKSETLSGQHPIFCTAYHLSTWVWVEWIHLKSVFSDFRSINGLVKTIETQRSR